MTNEIIEKILTSTLTSVDALKRVALWKEFLEFAFYGGASKSPQDLLEAFILERSVEEPHAETLRLWSKLLLATITSGTLYQHINEFLAALKSIPVLTIYTAVRFPPNELLRISERARSLLGARLLIDDRIEPSLYTGCAFVWKGIYHDHGLKRRFDNKRTEFLTLIARYA